MMQNPRYAADFEHLMSLCQQRNVAVQTIKSIARGGWHGQAQRHATWYEPLEEQTEIVSAIHWVLTRPSVFEGTVGDIYLLPNVLDAASRFQASHPSPSRCPNSLTFYDSALCVAAGNQRTTKRGA